MRDWRGPIAFVLAVGVAVTLVAGDVTAELTPGKVTTEEVSFLSTLAGAIIGAVATYLGVQHQRRNGGNTMTTEDPNYPEGTPKPSEPAEVTPPDKPGDETLVHEGDVEPEGDGDGDE